uniref:Uncharacterized protein n=1 Tax=Rhizophora mucronata TaxID=61149 RepID=A0A2P2NJB3_RHIMU
MVAEKAETKETKYF